MHFSPSSGRSHAGGSSSLLGRGNGGKPVRRFKLSWTVLIFAICIALSAVVLIVGTFFVQRVFDNEDMAAAPLERPGVDGRAAPRRRTSSTAKSSSAWGAASSYRDAPILVSYAYYEKDLIQKANFEFFIQAGWIDPATAQSVRWVFVVSGGSCSPCGVAFPLFTELEAMPEIGAERIRAVQDDPSPAELSRYAADADGATSGGDGTAAGSPEHRTLTWATARTLWITRTENVGMDLACHNVTLEVLARKRMLWSHRFFFFLNSSVRGPLAPSYMPRDWHWTHAFLERFGTLQGRHLAPGSDVHAVGSSLVCLPAQDAGGPGPRLESWAFALDDTALKVLLKHKVFTVRTCKLCTDAENSVVVGGEYGITTSLLQEGLNVAALMSRYARDIDWRDKRHWGCNENVHPSRHGTYDGIGFHPYETIFVKSSWHVSDPYTRRYSTWVTQHMEGDPGTEGEFNEEMYRYAISDEALWPNLLEAAYNVTRVRQLMNKQREQAAQELKEEMRAQAAREATHDV